MTITLPARPKPKVAEEYSAILKCFREMTVPEEQDFETTLPKDDFMVARLRFLKDNSERDLYVCRLQVILRNVLTTCIEQPNSTIDLV